MQISLKKLLSIFGIVFVGFLYALPSFLSETQRTALPHWMPDKAVNLGLDLQGGSQILLEANIDDALHDRLVALQDEVRTLLVANQVRYRELRIQASSDTETSGKIQFSLRDEQTTEKVRSVLAKLPGTQLTQTGVSLSLTFTPDELTRIRDTIMSRSIEIVSKRINELGTKEPSIQRQGRSRILVQMPGVADPSYVKEILGKTAKLTFHMVQGNAQSDVPPPGAIIVHAYENDQIVESLVLDKRPLLTGENLEDARPDTDEYGQPQITFSLDTAGSRKFGEITRKNIGKRFAMVLDDKILMAPSIRGHIPSGRAVITGRYTFKETYDTSLLMRSGALPAPLTTLEEKTVGPDLGADSILAGKQATVFAVVLVGIIMVVFYSFFGLLANIALIVNVILLVASLSAIGATLTLSGIAGIALTLGMAVDANVLIFERIKEEIRLGATAAQAIDKGFKQAMTTIVDSNLTTLIGGALLFQFGTGLLRGFAITLSLGIIISMFTAISFTRLLVEIYLKKARPTQLPI